MYVCVCVPRGGVYVCVCVCVHVLFDITNKAVNCLYYCRYCAFCFFCFLFIFVGSRFPLSFSLSRSLSQKVSFKNIKLQRHQKV